MNKTIQEAIKAKNSLEKDILSLIQTYEGEFGVKVKSIDFDAIISESFNGSKERYLMAVNLEVNL